MIFTKIVKRLKKIPSPSLQTLIYTVPTKPIKTTKSVTQYITGMSPAAYITSQVNKVNDFRSMMSRQDKL